MESHLFSRLYPDDYHRLREAAKRHALQLRQEAIRNATAWAAGLLWRAVRGALQSLRRGPPLRCAPLPLRRSSHQEPQAPCQPSF